MTQQSSQHSKGPQTMNGLRPSEQKYSTTSSTSSASVTSSSGGIAGSSNSSNNSTTAMNPPAQINGRTSTLFQKANPKQEQQSSMLPPLMSAPIGGPGQNVESILKMMTTNYLAPVSKIAATPRTEVAEQQPSKQHVYAELPPLFKPPTKPGTPMSRHKTRNTEFFLVFSNLFFISISFAKFRSYIFDVNYSSTNTSIMR